MDEIKEFIVIEEEEGDRLDVYLSEQLGDMSRSYIQKLIKDKKFDKAAALLKSIKTKKSQITAFWASNAEMLLTSLEAGDFGKYAPSKKTK